MKKIHAAIIAMALAAICLELIFQHEIARFFKLPEEPYIFALHSMICCLLAFFMLKRFLSDFDKKRIASILTAFREKPLTPNNIRTILLTFALFSLSVH